MLGEHSEQVLQELGYSGAEIQDLIAAGVTRMADHRHSIRHARA